MIYKFRDNVDFIIAEAECYIENKNTEERYGVSGAGIDFLTLVDGKRTFEEIIEELLNIYKGVEPLLIADDMMNFASELLSNCLLDVRIAE